MPAVFSTQSFLTFPYRSGVVELSSSSEFLPWSGKMYKRDGDMSATPSVMISDACSVPLFQLEQFDKLYESLRSNPT